MNWRLDGSFLLAAAAAAAVVGCCCSDSFVESAATGFPPVRQGRLPKS